MRRPPFRLWFKLANLPKVSIRDLARAGNRTPEDSNQLLLLNASHFFLIIIIIIIIFHILTG